VRSARTGDIDLLSGLGSPVLGWSGGNSGTRAAVASSALVDRGAERFEALYWRVDDRFAPHDLFTDTASLIESAREAATPPEPMLPFATDEAAGRAAAARGRPAAGAAVDFQGVDVAWVWDDGARAWLRFQDGAPHLVVSGRQLRAANVVILGTTYMASSADPLSPEAQSVGEGGAIVLGPAGRAVEGTWFRAGPFAAYELFDAEGEPISLEAGVTWVELPPAGSTTLLDAAAAELLVGS
ncbi:MAG: DUF3048 domain-containing protein, partial [Acidimicrobiia bacterium]|nr:DUF3048 domain-containing protein [Acidimicrobiia bacterium]